MQNRDFDPLGVPSEVFASLHPSLAVLERIMGELLQANDETVRAVENAKERMGTIDPTRWTDRIEKAHEDAEQLARLRADYDDSALMFNTAYLVYKIQRDRMMEGRSAISKAITDVLIAIEDDDQNDVRKDGYDLKAVMKARLMRAAAIHRGETVRRANERRDKEPENHVEVGRNIEDRVYKILVEAFKQLREESKSEHFLYMLPPTDSYYLSNFPKQSKANNRRHIWMVPFVDCVNSTHPHSANLPGLVEEVDAAIRLVCSLVSNLKGNQNGRINEVQHANRLVEMLYDDEPYAPRCGGNISQNIVAQDERRLSYTCYRQAVAVEVKKCMDLVSKLLIEFRNSMLETEHMLQEVSEDDRTTVDRWLTIKIMMNNCLATDIFVRRTIDQLAEAIAVSRKDLSRGAGDRALEDAFADCRKHYDFGLSKRREELSAKFASSESSG